MPLPKAVAKQAAEADRIVRNLNGANEPPPPDETVPPQDPPPAAPPQPAAPPPAPPPAPQPIAAPAQNEWETRYHTLQGKYNAEVPAMQQQLQNSLQAMGNMGRELDALKAQLAAAQQQAAQRPVEPQVTPQDVETWGPDMLDVIRRGAAEEAQKLLQPLMQENATLRMQLQQVQGQTEQVVQDNQKRTEQAFWTRLTMLCNDWERWNTDQGFIQWLGQFDPMLRTTRQNALGAAQQEMNADSVAAFFNAYKSTLPPPPVDPQRELARQITPTGRTSGAPAQTGLGAQTEEIWSQQEIMAFYTDVNRGKWRHDPQGMQETRARIDKAVSEGRVR